MKYKINKKIFLAAPIAFLLCFFLFQPAFAYTFSFDPSGTIAANSTLPTVTASPTYRIITIIQLALSVLGALSIIFLVYAGFLYAFSGGNSTNIDQAKKIIVWTVIGIIVVLGSFALMSFISENFVKNSNNGNGSDNGDGGSSVCCVCTDCPDGDFSATSTVDQSCLKDCKNGDASCINECYFKSCRRICLPKNCIASGYSQTGEACK